MDKYLLQILLETKTIIIPGLGALTITNEETGEIMFMSYLKYDDGELVKHIVDKEGFTENEAKNLIAKYVSEINARLGQGHDYEMFQFGKFYLKDGEIEFENWSASDKQTSSDSNEKLAEEVVADEEIVETSEEIIIPIPKVVIPDVESSETPMPEKSLDDILGEPKEAKVEIEDKNSPTEDASDPITSKENSYTPPQKEEVFSEQKEVEIEEVIVETPVEQDPIIEAINPTVQTKTAEKEKRKRKPAFWILIVLIVLLLSISSLTILFYDQVKQYLPFMESQRIEAERNKESAEEFSDKLNESAEEFENEVAAKYDENAETEMDEPVVEEKVEEVIKESVLPPAHNAINQSGRNYHVVVGAFGERANAERFSEKMNEAGNQASVLGQYDGLYLVSIDAYNSEAEANQSISKFNDITSKAWVFHKR